MKNLYTIKFASIFILLFITCFCEAQPFAPVGAKWYYTRGKTYNLSTMECVGDTLIGSLLFRKVKVISYKNPQSKRLESMEYLWGNKDSILYYNYHHGNIFKLYDFTKDSGSLVVVHEGMFKPTDAFQIDLWNKDSIDGYSYIVGKKDSIYVNDVWINRQVIHYKDYTAWRMDTRNLSYISPILGSTGYFFGSYTGASVAESDDILRCYDDGDINFKNVHYLQGTCDAISTGTTDLNIERNQLNIYPNPVNQTLMVQWLQNMYINSVSVYNLNGQLILSEKSTLNGIDVSMLSGGVYYVTITTNNGSVYRSKFVKL
jgi:hypothetical protein